MSIPASPARTHALLVGIEKYDAGGGWNKLRGPVNDVREFYAWLRKRDVPDANIITFTSPLDNALPNCALAGSAELDKGLAALHGRSGDLLFIYWSGHGIRDEGRHRLFLADATLENKRNLDFDLLRDSLRSEYFAKFPHQIIIVDACANDSIGKVGHSFPSIPIPVWQAIQHRQFVLYAARPGQFAKDLQEERRGLLSREFMRQVANSPANEWPPDMRRVTEEVQAEFVRLRETGDFRDLNQTPVYRISEDWNGNVIEMRGRPAVAGSANPREVHAISSKQVFLLADALGTISILKQPAGRNLVLGQLRSAIAASTSRAGDKQTDLIHIVRRAAEFSGGLGELLWTVAEFDHRSDSWTRVEKLVAEQLPWLALKSGALSEDAGPHAAEKLELVAALELCGSLAGPSDRDLIVSSLDGPISSRVVRHSDMHADLFSVVQSCSEYAGGIEELLSLVEAREKGASAMPRVRAAAKALLVRASGRAS